MFQISDVHIPACITTYDAAVRLHTKRRPWRGGGDDNIRPLGGRRQRWLTIRRDDNGDLVARMYQTDIIRWRPDGAIALMPFTTQGTSRVVNTLLRGTGCYAMYTGPLGPCLWLDHYAPRDAATIVRMNACGATVVQVDPQTKRFDRHAEEAPAWRHGRACSAGTASRALYATYNLTGFRAWLAAWHALTPEDTTHPYIYRNAMMAAGDWTGLLADPTLWPVLGAACRIATYGVRKYHRGTIQDAVATLRKSLWRQHPEVIQTTLHDRLSLAAFHSTERMHRQYRMYIPYDYNR